MPLNIPGTSIRPPDRTGAETKCPRCGRRFTMLKKKINPLTKKPELFCPYCNENLEKFLASRAK